MPLRTAHFLLSAGREGLIQEKNIAEGEVLRINEWEAAGRFFLGGFLVLIGLAYVFGKAGHAHNLAGSLVPVVGGLLAVLGVYVSTSSRCGLIVEEDGIAVQGTLRRRREWAKVRRLELTRAIYGSPLRIEFADGDRLRVTGFRSRSREQRELAEAWVAALNRRSDDARGSGDVNRAQ